MNLVELQAFNGCCVEVSAFGQPALAVLFCSPDLISVTTLCFVNEKRTCPMRSYELADEDIESLKPVGRKRLTSAICIDCQDPSSLQGDRRERHMRGPRSPLQ